MSAFFVLALSGEASSSSLVGRLGAERSIAPRIVPARGFDEGLERRGGEEFENQTWSGSCAGDIKGLLSRFWCWGCFLAFWLRGGRAGGEGISSRDIPRGRSRAETKSVVGARLAGSFVVNEVILL